MADGKFITFEGGEGSGKSTQARLLAERLRERGLDVVLTREPGGSPFAEALRSIILDAETPPHSPLSEALLFYSARADHLDKTIRPALEEGRWVICDRFSDSTRVYQCAAGGLPVHIFEALEEMIVKPTTPDLTIVLDLPAEVGLSRAGNRREETASASAKPDAYEKRALEFHQALRDAFVAIARSEPARCTLIDGNTQEDIVGREVWRVVDQRLLAEVC